MNRKQFGQKNKMQGKLLFCSTESGFSLIEMIVAVSIFTMVVFVSVGALMSITDANRKMSTIRTTMDNINFALESMSRNIRTGKDYQVLGGGSQLSFTDQSGNTVRYRFNNPTKSIQTRTGGGPFEDITSPEVVIESLRFYAVGVGNDNIQPRVLITIKGTSGALQKIMTEFSLQTTVSQRNIES